MKRTLIAAILGVVASVASSYGQGSINFNTYAANNYGGNPPGALQVLGLDGVTPLAGTWNAQLVYALGNSLTDTAGGGPGSLLPQLVLNGAVESVVVGSAGPGQFDGGIYTIPNYISGNVQIEMLTFNGSSYATSSIRGHSALVTFASIATGVATPGNLDGVASFQVISVPEPATFALAGLGAAAMLIFRRRK